LNEPVCIIYKNGLEIRFPSSEVQCVLEFVNFILTGIQISHRLIWSDALFENSSWTRILRWKI